jgi:twitching motility protein PilI
MGLRNATEMEAQTEIEAGSPAWAQRCYRDRDLQLWTELALSSIVQDPQFLQVGV